MSSSVLVPLFLLLSLLIFGTQGLRLQKGLMALDHQKYAQKFHEESNNDEDTSARDVVTLCKSGQCSSGKGRKLMMVGLGPSPTTATTTPLKNVNGRESNAHQTWMHKSGNGRGGEDDKFSGNKWVTTGYPEAAPNEYSGAMDISEMDYSPAKKKPPIHN